jgi:outer membrane protein assembly factor BamE (lipoprotein component of BamABCDE complex)
MLDGESIKSFEVGVTDRGDIRDALGSPSTQSTFGEETWYYIHNEKEQAAFFEAEIVDQRVVSFVFDEYGTLAQIENFTEADARDIQMVTEETPTEGHSLTFFEQLLGNIGKFNAPSGGTGRVPRGAY